MAARRGKRSSFLDDMASIKSEGKGADSVQFELPLSILKYPHEKLRAPNAEVTAFDARLHKLSRAMFDIMYKTDGVGLAAPQVGVNVRLMVYNPEGEPGRGKEYTLVNPTITETSDEFEPFEEGCLSFPKMFGDVERPVACVVKARDTRGKKVTLKLDGFQARVFQHEYDHLDQKLFIDRMDPEVLASVQPDLDRFIAEFSSEYEGVGTAL